ncbi:hypothetical protein NHX12_025880 [Muraenolepis orangiensis]|uniref:Uncharacterized protein n=1 Tax=Muraenolepis orangiensis TaxID=630683 RepID=A0A9Q0EGH5_9TELE|nr:hypothetical protein NHX12_025880 [Muraenolepis orangiensis]
MLPQTQFEAHQSSHVSSELIRADKSAISPNPVGLPDDRESGDERSLTEDKGPPRGGGGGGGRSGTRCPFNRRTTERIYRRTTRKIYRRTTGKIYRRTTRKIYRRTTGEDLPEKQPGEHRSTWRVLPENNRGGSTGETTGRTPFNLEGSTGEPGGYTGEHRSSRRKRLPGSSDIGRYKVPGKTVF